MGNIKFITREEFVKEFLNKKYDSETTHNVVNGAFHKLDGYYHEINELIQSGEKGTDITHALDMCLLKSITTYESCKSYKTALDTFATIHFGLTEEEFKMVAEFEPFYPLIMENIETCMREIVELYKMYTYD